MPGWEPVSHAWHGDDGCTFQDECAAAHAEASAIYAASLIPRPAVLRIDTYTLDKWILGTAKLFDGSK